MKSENLNELNFLNCLIDSLEEGIIVLDRDLKIKKTNKWILSKAGKKNNILQSYCYNTFHQIENPCPDCPVLKTFESARINKTVVSTPFKEKKDVVYEITTSPVMNEKGEVDFVIEKYNDITHLNNFEPDLLESKEKYKALYNNAPLAYQSLNAGGFIIDVNPAWQKTLGYNRDEIIGKWFGDFLHPDFVTHFRKNFSIFKKQGYIHNVRFRMLKKDKSEIFVSFEGCVGYNTNGTFKQTYCTFKDITIQKQIEEELINNKTTLERLFLVAPTGIGQVKNRIFVDVNQRFSEMTGYAREELIGKSTLMIYPSKEEYEYVGTEKYAQIAKNGTGSVTTKIKKKNGEIIDVIMSSTPIDADNISSGVIFTALDITQRKEFERQLIEKNREAIVLNKELEQSNKELLLAKEESEENERKLKNLLGNLKGMAYQSKNDEHWTMSFISQGVKELTGYNVTDIKDNKLIGWNQIIHEDFREQVATKVNKALANQKSFTIEYKIRCKNGEEKWVWEKGIAETKDNEILHIEGFITDITPLKTYEQELIKAKEKAEVSDHLKTAFLLNISHEIRTPMNGILGFIELLNQPELSEEERLHFIDVIHKSGDRLLDTINNIVEISKIEVGDLKLNYEHVNLMDLMQYYYDFFKIQTKEKGLGFEITNQIEGSGAVIKTDKQKLDGILMNLIKNAVKFTDKGKIGIGNYLKDGNLWFYVKDTGRGIPHNKQNAIFERFVQADAGLTRYYEGSGIGLSIVKAYVEILKGSIKVESEPGKGSTFSFYVPYFPFNVGERQTETDIAVIADVKGSTILVAEDDFVNLQLLDKILNLEYKLLFAHNGAEAVSTFMDHQDVSLILMDIKMPGEYNGLEATRKIREINSKVPIIAQTAYSSESERKNAATAGCTDYISKPYRFEELKSLIKKYI